MEALYTDDLGKIEDAGAIVRGGGIDRHWQTITPEKKFLAMFGKKRQDAWLFDSNTALAHFNLRSIEFGNWMTQQDRANFLYAATLSLHHLAKVLNIKDDDIGMGGRLSLALGARGHGQAKAHYEPTPYGVINLTKTQGFGSLAHEYAHALDNVISFLARGKETYVSGGRETRKGYNPTLAKKGNFFEQQFEEFFNLLYFNKKGEETQFSRDISNFNKGDYYERRNEVFARSFEVYIFNLLNDTKIKNTFLVDSNYKAVVYPNPTLSALVKPIIARIVSKSFSEIRKNKQTLEGVATSTGYKGFRTTLKESASLNDTLIAMKRIALRDFKQVEGLARELKGNTIAETSENIWEYLRENTRYKLDNKGIEELRTPARSIVDGQKGLHDTNFGIDCDDYTILVSALLLNLGIDHEYRVTAYEEVGKFQHIYPVAFDTDGTPYVIDIVPEIPRFNYEEQPIIDLKTIPMELHELSGVEPEIIDQDDVEITDEEILNDFAEEMDEGNTIAGIDNDDDTMLDNTFLSGFTEVMDEEDADIVLNGTSDTIALLERGILAEVNKAREVLANEKRQPTVISQLVDVNMELRILDNLMQSWQDEDLRDSTLMSAIRSNSQYTNFFRAIKSSLDQLQHEQLNGFDDDELNEPLYLARIPNNEDLLLDVLQDEDDEDLEGFDDMYDDDYEDDEDLEGLGMLDDEFEDYDDFEDFEDSDTQDLSGFFKKVFRKIGKVAKKVVKAVVRFNPATLAMRGAIILVLKMNLFKFSEKLIYGYLTQAQAKQQGLNLNEWRRRVQKLRRAEKFFTKIGGRASKFRKAIVRGKGGRRAKLPLRGLGAVATTTVAPASGFIVFMKSLLKKINPIRLIKKGVQKIKSKIANRRRPPRRTIPQRTTSQRRSIPRRTQTRSTFPRPATRRTSTPVPVQRFTPTQSATSFVNTSVPETPKQGFLEKVKQVFTRHKRKWIIAIVLSVFAIVGYKYYQKSEKKKKRSLAGIKAARTRAKNRKQLASAPKRRTTAKRRTPVKRRTPRALPARPVSGTRKRKTSNGNRLKAMHREAKKLQKTHPKTKYSTLLKRAAKKI
ncbi:LPD1 domain-containing protein [Aquimarina algiphila]|uniref:LPD1 domain-containing protein n=1 Tax=Aquimarina algiphila TaxID=2047982 RepID=UPI00232AEF3F|nr:LPD1 domain-containing protein [Aquimarina algiphila]